MAYTFTDEETKIIIDLYTKDILGLLTIGKEFGVSKKVITRILKVNNIQIRPSGGRYKGGKVASDKRYREKDGYKEKQQKYMEEYYPKYYEENKEIRSEYAKEYRTNNIDKEKARHKKYYDENKDKLNEYREEYKTRRNLLHKENMINDPLYKAKHNIRGLIKQSFRTYTKKSKTQDILGCTFEEFKEHIESQWNDWMNWDNHGNPKDNIFELDKTWDLDHIIPLSTAKTEEDVIRLNHYTNFQPLCSYNNRFIKRNLILQLVEYQQTFQLVIF